MRKPTIALVVMAVAVAGLGLWLAGTARGATGDNLVSFNAAVTAGIPSCGVGTGNAFDGTQIYLSCWGSNVLERVDAVTHLSNGPITISGVSDIGAMAWDSSRGKIWACSSGSGVVLIDPTGLSATSQFSTGGCIDGLAYDGADDTIWASDDAVTTLNHYDNLGTLIDTFDLTGKIGAYGNSGIAVGGTNLYLANNGGSQIYECDKSLVTCTLISTFPERIEDLECDNVTFAPKGAIWSQDAYDRIQNAWEIPAGLCAFGGAVQPTPTPTPSPTPSPAATATPSPTPTSTPAAQLPATGGDPSDSGGLPWLVLAAGVIAIASGGLVLAYRTRRTR